MYEAVVPLLAKRFTVLTFDRRGNSRSPLTAAPGPADLAEQAADAVAIPDHVGFDRSFVFGSNSGALIALELLARYADRLAGVVVHEPPIIRILPDAAVHQQFFAQVARIAADEGTVQAFLAFAATTMDNPFRLFESRLGRSLAAVGTRVISATTSAVRRIARREPDGMQRLFGNAEYLVKWEMPGFVEYEPDLQALRRSGVPWCFVTGEASEGRYYSRPAHVLSEELSVTCVEFPGGHLVYQQFPEESSSRLAEILTEFEVSARG